VARNRAAPLGCKDGEKGWCAEAHPTLAGDRSVTTSARRALHAADVTRVSLVVCTKYWHTHVKLSMQSRLSIE
jgi:hypothetical protein